MTSITPTKITPTKRKLIDRLIERWLCNHFSISNAVKQEEGFITKWSIPENSIMSEFGYTIYSDFCYMKVWYADEEYNKCCVGKLVWGIGEVQHRTYSAASEPIRMVIDYLLTDLKDIISTSVCRDTIIKQSILLMELFLQENSLSDCEIHRRNFEIYYWQITPVSKVGIRREDDMVEFWRTDRYGHYHTIFIWNFPYEVKPLSGKYKGTIYERLWELVYSIIPDEKKFIPGEKSPSYPDSTTISTDNISRSWDIINKMNYVTKITTNKEEINMNIKTVFFNEVKGITTVVFNDHTSVIVRCMKGDTFDPEVGLAMALSRKYFGSRTKFQKFVQDWVKKSEAKNTEIKEKLRKKAERDNSETDT